PRTHACRADESLGRERRRLSGGSRSHSKQKRQTNSGRLAAQTKLNGAQNLIPAHLHEFDRFSGANPSRAQAEFLVEGKHVALRDAPGIERFKDEALNLWSCVAPVSSRRAGLRRQPTKQQKPKNVSHSAHHSAPEIVNLLKH